MRNRKSDESCTSNPKTEISDWTVWHLPNVILRLSDLRRRIRPISDFARRCFEYVDSLTRGRVVLPNSLSAGQLNSNTLPAVVASQLLVSADFAFGEEEGRATHSRWSLL